MGVVGSVSHVLGARRRFIRRIAGLCLVLMGVHVAADRVLNDALVHVLDVIDLFVDNGFASIVQWLVDHGGFTPAGGAQLITREAAVLDLEQKEWLALRGALVLELLIDLALVPLVWGVRTSAEPQSLFAEVRDSARELWRALQIVDVERLVAAPTLLLLAVGGAVSSGLALEQLTRDALGKFAPEVQVSGTVAAIVGVGAASLLVARIVPDLLQGALQRSHARAVQLRERHNKLHASTTSIHTTGQRVRRALQRLLRGLWLVVLVLPLAISGMGSQDVMGLFARIGAGP